MGRPRTRTEEDVKRQAFHRVKKWRKENPEKLAEQTRRRRETYGEKERARSREWYKQNRESIVAKIWPNNLRRFGMSTDDYLAQLEAQENRCAICKEERREGERRFAVDHCHSGLQVRGLLCSRCNIGLGQFRERADLLTAAIAYLNQPGTKYQARPEIKSNQKKRAS